MPDEAQPEIQKIKDDLKPWWGWAVALLLLCTMGPCSYSLKKETDELKKTSATHSEAVTIREPVEVAGKVVYKETIRSVHDTLNTEDKKKEVTIIKSGFSLGLAYGGAINDPLNKSDWALWAVPDLLPLGPGNIQGMGLIGESGHYYIGAGYHLNF